MLVVEGVVGVDGLRAELARAWAEVDAMRAERDAVTVDRDRLLLVVEDQAKALASLTDDCPPHAPTLGALYWLYCPTRWHEPNWDHVWHRLVPLVNELGDLPAMKLTPLVWSEHRARRKAQIVPVTGKPPKDSTLNTELMRAKELLKWAVSHKLIKYSPLAAAKGVATIISRETWLAPDQIDKLLLAAEDVVDERLAEGDDDGFRSRALKALILCWHDSMLRVGESLSVRRDRIGGDGRLELYSSETKGRRRRVVFLTPRTLEAIADVPVDPGSPFVFSRGGKRIIERTVHYWWSKAREKAGVDVHAAPGELRVRRHDLRASGASTADEHGARATAIRDALGHRHISTTSKYLRSEQAENARSVAAVIVEATERRGPRKAHRNNEGRQNRQAVSRIS